MNRLSFVLLVICLVLSSRIQAQNVHSDTVPDTTITYFIDDVSTEGAAATVKYRHGAIVEAVVMIYGCSFQTEVAYLFLDDSIRVKEQQFLYNGTLEDVKTNDDMRPGNSVQYSIDYDGRLLEKIDKEYADVYKDFKKVVPFSLKL